MGSLAAQDMAAHAPLDLALSWHLSSNHFPPVPAAFAATCAEAIRLAKDGEWDEEVELPMGCNTCRVLIPWDAEIANTEWKPGPHGIGRVIVKVGEPVGHEGHEIVHDAVLWNDDRDVATVAALVESFHLESFL